MIQPPRTSATHAAMRPTRMDQNSSRPQWVERGMERGPGSQPIPIGLRMSVKPADHLDNTPESANHGGEISMTASSRCSMLSACRGTSTTSRTAPATTAPDLSERPSPPARAECRSHQGLQRHAFACFERRNTACRSVCRSTATRSPRPNSSAQQGCRGYYAHPAENDFLGPRACGTGRTMLPPTC